MGRVVSVAIGAPIAYAALAAIRDRQALSEHLRQVTYALAHGAEAGPASPQRPIRLRRRPRNLARAA